MAKTVRQQLSDLVAGKKPNLFYKGLNTDTDEHIISNLQYSAAKNVRLNAKDGDLGTLQNLKSTHLAGVTGLKAYKFSHTTVANKLWFSHDGVAAGNPNNETIYYISFKFKNTDSTYHQFNGSVYYNVGTTSDDFGSDYQSQSSAYSNQQMLLHCYEVMKNDIAFTSVMSVSLSPATTVNGPVYLIFTPINQDKDPASVEIDSLYPASQYEITSSVNTWTADYYTEANPLYLHPVSLTSFSDYIAAICWHSSSVQFIVKIFVTKEGEISSIEPIIIGDFGIDVNYKAIVVEKIEENENYNRIYWSDGVNPIKTINLNANASFYSNFNSVDSFNLFSNSPLAPPSIISVTDTGSVNCGSWSYCYRLITTDGKFSVVSPITNPLPLLQSSKSGAYEAAIGGTVAENSGKSVFLTISNVELVYSRIQLIGIQYLDNHGGAAFFLLKDEKINGNLVNLTHTGNEITTPITAAEILSKSNTWDIAQDIAIKDNRLLAANLKNTSSTLIADQNTFRVKSWKHSAAAASFDTAPGSGYYTATSELNNPDVYTENLYRLASTDTTKYRFAYAGTGGSEKMQFGASTSGYNESNANGVYVTFKLHPFKLDSTEYWNSIAPNDDASFPQNTNDDGYCIPPFYGPLAKNGDDGYFNNYKNPIFANKYVGYMRDEIYRFGIQLFDKDGNQTFTYPIGDIRFPPIESDYRVIGTTPGDYTPTAGGSAFPLKYILQDSNGDGYILYPEFRVKLSSQVVKNVSGFNIVRAVRNDTDKRVVAAGLLNNTLIHNNSTDNGHFKNRIGIDKQSLFTQVTGTASFGDSEQSSLVTLDSPDAMFGLLNYTSNQSHQIKIVNKLKCRSYLNTQKPTGTTDNFLHLANSTDDVTWMRDNSTNSIFYAAPMASDFTGTSSGDFEDNLEQLSMFSKYHSDGDGDSALTSSANSSYYIKNIHYGQVVGAGEIVPNSLTNESQDFINSAWVYAGSGATGHDLNYLKTSSSLINHSSGKTQNGNTTILVAMDASEVFDMDHSNLNIASSDIRVEGNNYSAAKPYAKIINPITADSGQYGGNTITNFENTRWISTGASVHGSALSSTSEMIVPVFGGDTYVNIFSLNKFHKKTYGEPSTFRITQGFMFPVESSLNIDLRDGDFFGKNRPNLNKEDDYSYNNSYSASNNLKSFPAKDSTIDLVTDFKNMIAVSNVKIAGQTQDAFSKFDANEIFEVNANYGAISNLALFRNNIYSIQENGTSILSINTRALINSKDGSAISIQSALGTGSVIERNDYISTKYGSQNRINVASTDLGLFWYDGINNTICEVDVKSPHQVADLSSIKGCSFMLDFIKNKQIYSNPINVTLPPATTKDMGGLDISYNPRYNELIFSFSYLGKNNLIDYKSISYDEALGVFTSERSYSTFINTHHNGILYSVGAENSQSTETIDSNRKNIHSHDTLATSYNNFYGQAGGSPFVEFTNNEEVGSLKVYDKLIVNNNGLSDSRIFTTFVYSTNNDALSSLDLSSTAIDRMGVGKHIIPIHKNSGRFKGNYLKVKMTQSENESSQEFNLFSAISHYRKNII